MSDSNHVSECGLWYGASCTCQEPHTFASDTRENLVRTVRRLQGELDGERNRVRAAERILNRVADGGTAVLAARAFLRASTILAEWPEDIDCQHLWHETRTAKRADHCPACNEANLT